MADKRGYDWIADRIREFVRENFPGQCADEASIRFGDRQISLVIPPDEREKNYRHSADFCSIVWNDHPYSFTPAQSHAVALLWTAWENGTPDVAGVEILEAAGSSGEKATNVFRDCEAWRDGVIGPGLKKGTLRLRAPEDVA